MHTNNETADPNSNNFSIMEWAPQSLKIKKWGNLFLNLVILPLAEVKNSLIDTEINTFTRALFKFTDQVAAQIRKAISQIVQRKPTITRKIIIVNQMHLNLLVRGVINGMIAKNLKHSLKEKKFVINKICMSQT
jgi:hypothetical protein